MFVHQSSLTSNGLWGAAILVGSLVTPAVGQVYCKTAKLLPTDGAFLDNPRMGSAVSISGDVALMGAPDDDDNGHSSGSAYVYRQTGGVWELDQKLLAFDGGGLDSFGASLDIDGTVAVIGAPGVGARAAYVFRYNGSGWIQEQKLIPSIGGVVASSVAIQRGSSGGNAGADTVLMGVPWQFPNAGNGRVVVFRFNGVNWIEQQVISPPGTTGYESTFGRSVALYGNVALIGRPGGLYKGAAYVYRFDGASWKLEQELTRADWGQSPGFGGSVDLDDGVAFIGAYGDQYNVGSGYIYRFDGAIWQQEQKLLAFDGQPFDAFGRALSIDGDSAVIGAPYDDDHGINTGSAYIFRFDGVSWNQTQKLLPDAGNPFANNYGIAVAAGGGTALVGSLGEVNGNESQGATYVYVDLAGECPPDPIPVTTHDILWRHDDGPTFIWLMDGTQRIGQGSPGSVGQDWQIAGVGDFDGDGHADILWRNQSTGQVAVWYINGTRFDGGGSVGGVNMQWTIEGIANFDGMGGDDILWRHASGVTVIWLMNGTNVAEHGSPGSVDQVWQIAGVGDFDGDGRGDILWRNQSTGQVAVWYINGTQFDGGGSAGSLDPNVWEIAGIGDFDGVASTPTSTSDILWRNNNGQTLIWLMDGTQRIGQGSPGTVGPVWQIAGVGDLDADGRSDILWRHQSASGQVFAWFIDGTDRVGQGPLGGVSHEWQIAGIDDFDGE